MQRPFDPSDPPSDPLAPMPPGELREEGVLQVRDLLAPLVAPKTPRSGWKALFDVWDSRELVGRLADGDPLSLRTRVLRTCRERALLLHADRMLLRALALCAYRGMHYSGSPPLERWCDDVVVSAARDLLSEDLEREFDGEALPEEDRVLFRMFVELFGVEPALSRLASVRFHQADADRRSIVWAATVQGRSMDEIAATRGESPLDVEHHLRTVLTSLSERRGFTWSDLGAYDEDVT